jgi:hypothetical protein
MAKNGKSNPYLTPESLFYDTLKGGDVYVLPTGKDLEPIMHLSGFTATLLWVDRFSVGLRILDREFLMYKHSIQTIEAIGTKAEGTNDNGDASGAIA